ncbi:zinc finger protein ZAT9-like [Salvia divinorum]|uniref:Zinc finger protein ZAT9-like n=1 Tax=Salvia divinorum TaxID=28513 RepID=A0ABD1G3T2_SALDI
MGQGEEQRYVCRICSKACVSGMSLGGHMRAHFASNGAANSCRECGKEFVSSRALSGHMRCHSIKNEKRVHSCKECGRGFESMRAVFGHMKSHSAKRVTEVAGGVVAGSFCPVRRKRSRVVYKGAVSPSFSGVDASRCGASELEEAEEAARCLVMLSRGVGSFSNLGSCSDRSGGVAAASTVSEFDDGGMLRVGNGMDVDLDLVCDEGFLKDGDGESCENGADLEMVDEEKRRTKSRVEKEMESGGSGRGSLRGAASMRRCCSLLEKMDVVAVIW